MDKSWPWSGEAPWRFILDGCKARVNWAKGKKDLAKPQDVLDDADWDALYWQECEDKDEMLELEGSVYGQLGATTASTPVTTNTEAATSTNALSMGLPETLASNLLDSQPNLLVQAPYTESVSLSTGLEKLFSTTLDTVIKSQSLYLE